MGAVMCYTSIRKKNRENAMFNKEVINKKKVVNLLWKIPKSFANSVNEVFRHQSN